MYNQTRGIQTEGKQYFCFITLMRALAAILITNAHYTGIYPSDIIANGGLLGDVMFFSVSGFCLASPQWHFGRWYAKRLWRIYAVVWVATLTFVLAGAWQITSVAVFITTFIHPTKYHFVASITLLYIPLYFVTKYVELSKKNYTIAAVSLLVAQLIIYLTVYDRSSYHIDTVREPMIEFLFFQTMLLGLYMRKSTNHSDMDGNSKSPKGKRLGQWVLLVVLLCLYFISKLLFVKKESLSDFQILNQVVLYVALFMLFKVARSYELSLKKMESKWFWKLIVFLSDHTLEIYCVQYVLIEVVRKWGLPFPMNWFVLTTVILLAAFALRKVSQLLIKWVKV